MKTRQVIANYYNSKEERDNEKIKAIESGLNVLYESEMDNESETGKEYGFTYEIIDNFQEIKATNIDYDNLLDEWHEQVVEKADRYQDRADDCEFGSSNYFKFKSYSDGLYMALSMLSLEERKSKRKLK